MLTLSLTLSTPQGKKSSNPVPGAAAEAEGEIAEDRQWFQGPSFVKDGVVIPLSFRLATGARGQLAPALRHTADDAKALRRNLSCGGSFDVFGIT